MEVGPASMHNGVTFGVRCKLFVMEIAVGPRNM